jgi:aconitate hydratase
MSSAKAFEELLRPLPDHDGRRFFDLSKLDEARYKRLPFSVRVLLEAAVR